MVGGRRGLQPVHRLGGDRQRGVEAERHVGAEDVVVDGLGNPDDRDPFGLEPPGDREASIAADHEQALDAVTRQCPQHGVRPVLVGSPVGSIDRYPEGIVAVGSAEDGSALRQDAGDVVEAERPGLVREQPGEAVEEAGDPDVVPVRRRLDHRSQRGVHARAIAARRHHPDVLRTSHGGRFSARGR